MLRPIVRVAQAPAPEGLRAGFANRYLFSTLRSLAIGLPAGDQMPQGSLAGKTLREFLEATGPARGTAGDAELILFDQFEEILAVVPNAIAEKEAFFDQVGEALRGKKRWALFWIREDFVSALDPYLRRIPGRLAIRFRLDLLGVDVAPKAMAHGSRSVGAADLAQGGHRPPPPSRYPRSRFRGGRCPVYGVNESLISLAP